MNKTAKDFSDLAQEGLEVAFQAAEANDIGLANFTLLGTIVTGLAHQIALLEKISNALNPVKVDKPVFDVVS